ncbi:DUF6538 domain-containing protein [Methylobacter sp. S3L5C]|uniref:DUF6538 domain-containing protein n=1 Tax=Methylobacter sp. S3L5C TaxID=2839024 RepID=UPI00352C0E7D
MYYRRRIPVLLRPLFGCLEFIISLKTTCFQDAKELATIEKTSILSYKLKSSNLGSTRLSEMYQFLIKSTNAYLKKKT